MERLRFNKFFLALFFFVYVFFAYPVDLTFKLTPSAEFPFKTVETRRYDDVGGGGFLDLGLDLFNFMNVGAELGYVVLPKENYKNIIEEGYEPIVSFIPIGLQLGAFFYPLSRIETALGRANAL